MQAERRAVMTSDGSGSVALVVPATALLAHRSDRVLGLIISTSSDSLAY
jgi:hypothetical protein